MTVMQLDTKELKKCLEELDRVLPIIQKAIPQLRTLIQIADAFGSVSIRAEVEKPKNPSMNGPKSSPSKMPPAAAYGVPETVIDKVRLLLDKADARMPSKQIFNEFRSREWNPDMKDPKLRHLLHGTLWRLKKVGEVDGNAEDGWQLKEKS